ncbi:MAG TPA: hypothetical protein VFW95_10425 [Candidatus Limnocylindria bacterium]|nr:hypothetical protein [Candidatus Limnocylindria bacterium]
MLAEIGPTMSADGYLHAVLPVELVGEDADGMGVMLRVLTNGSPSWLEAYRDDGRPFLSRPPVTTLRSEPLW